jgi:hypothetical protein
MSRLMQCQAKASSMQDILQLLTSKGSSKSSTPAPAVADDAGSATAAAALRGCLGTATSLLQALAAHKKEVFQAWQVRLLFTHAGCSVYARPQCYAVLTCWVVSGDSYVKAVNTLQPVNPCNMYYCLLFRTSLVPKPHAISGPETHLLPLFSPQDGVRSQLADMASWKSSRLISFDAASSHVRCQFSEGLVGLLREVRQLQALGFGLRRELLAEVETAGKFYRCAWFSVWLCCQLVEKYIRLHRSAVCGAAAAG